MYLSEITAARQETSTLRKAKDIPSNGRFDSPELPDIAMYTDMDNIREIINNHCKRDCCVPLR